MLSEDRLAELPLDTKSCWREVLCQNECDLS